jgi:ABC-2 type transport system ATP-binding protein
MQPAVVLESVSKTFRHRPALFNWLGRERSGETSALKSISLAASVGQVLAILGPNGSGKTTLLKLVCTVLLPDSGRVVVGGADTRQDSNSVRRQVGISVANERSFFPRLTARENLDFFAVLEDVPAAQRAAAIESALRDADLVDATDMLVMKFSSGLYQRLAIARALVKSPSVLLLDEPSRSLDPVAKTALWNLIRARANAGAAVILATHDFDEAVAVADRVAVLKNGSLEGESALDVGRSVETLRSFYLRAVGATQTERVFAGERR